MRKTRGRGRNTARFLEVDAEFRVYGRPSYRKAAKPPRGGGPTDGMQMDVQEVRGLTQRHMTLTHYRFMTQDLL